MKKLLTYLKCTFVLSVKQTLIYPTTFWIVFFVIPLWSVLQIIFLETIYGQTTNFVGYTKYEAFILFGTFTIVQTIGHMLFHWKLADLKSMIKGYDNQSFDRALTLPIDAQISATLGKFNFGNIAPFFVAVCIVIYGINHQVEVITVPGVLVYVAFILLALCLFYLTFLLLSTLLFWFPDLQTTEQLWESFMDFGQYPTTLYKGVVGSLFNLVIPITLMAAIPADSLLGKIGIYWLAIYILIVGIFFIISRKFWLISIKKYSSFSS